MFDFPLTFGDWDGFAVTILRAPYCSFRVSHRRESISFVDPAPLSTLFFGSVPSPLPSTIGSPPPLLLIPSAPDFFDLPLFRSVLVVSPTVPPPFQRCGQSIEPRTTSLTGTFDCFLKTFPSRIGAGGRLFLGEGPQVFLGTSIFCLLIFRRGVSGWINFVSLRSGLRYDCGRPSSKPCLVPSGSTFPGSLTAYSRACVMALPPFYCKTFL